MSRVGQELAVVAKTAKEAAKLFHVRGHWHTCRGGSAIIVGANTIGRDDVAQKVDTCGTDPGFIRRELQAMEAQTREEGS